MRFWLPAVALLVVTVGTAWGQSAHRYMGWGDSTSQDQDFTPNCSALPDQSKLVVSFDAPPGIGNLQGVWGYVDFCTKPNPVPPWWTFAPYSGCRADSLSASADFSTGPFTRVDPWAGRGQASFT